VEIWNLLVFNRALLDKWPWRYVHERKAWWRAAVDSKFGSSWGGCVLLSPLEHLGCGYERIFGGVRRNFHVRPDLSWEMAPRLDPGMISGVGM
jgi:hypothetical protein